MRPKVVVVDIDGTLALRGTRSPYDWGSVSDDQPNAPIAHLVKLLATQAAVLYVSGREDSCRQATEEWIARNVGVPGALFMRVAGDNRKDSALKREIYERDIRPRYFVWLVLDDRAQTVAMWRTLGLVCLQVDAGDF